MVRKQLLKPALYRYFSIPSNKLSLAFHVTNAFLSWGECTLPNHLAPTLAPGSWSQTICAAHMHVCIFIPSECGNKSTSSLRNKTGLARELLLAGSTGYAVSLSLCPAETSNTPQASQPGTATAALALCPRAHLTEHRQHVINSFCELQSNPLITLGKVFSHIVKAGSYQLLLSSFLGNPTRAAQTQPKPSAFMSPSSFSRQNHPMLIPCFLPSSALLTEQSVLFPGAKETQLTCTAKNLLLI